MVMPLLLYHLQIPALQMVSFPAIYVQWLKGKPVDQWDKLAGQLRSPYSTMTKTVRATIGWTHSSSSDNKICWQNSLKQEDGIIKITKSTAEPSVRGGGSNKFNLKCLHQDPTALPQLPTAQREDFRQLGVGLLRRHRQSSYRADENHQGSACLELRWPSLDDAGCVWRIFWLTVKNPPTQMDYVGWKLDGFHEFRQDFWLTFMKYRQPLIWVEGCPGCPTGRINKRMKRWNWKHLDVQTQSRLNTRPLSSPLISPQKKNT